MEMQTSWERQEVMHLQWVEMVEEFLEHHRLTQLSLILLKILVRVICKALLTKEQDLLQE